MVKAKKLGFGLTMLKIKKVLKTSSQAKLLKFTVGTVLPLRETLTTN